MTRTLIRVGIALALLVPAVALAQPASNPVTLTTSTILHVSGADLLVSGSSAAMDSIQVSDNGFTVTVEAGSKLTVTSADHRIFEVHASNAVGSFTCEERDGFTWGELELVGDGPDEGGAYRIWSKNENLMAWRDGAPDVVAEH